MGDAFRSRSLNSFIDDIGGQWPTCAVDEQPILDNHAALQWLRRLLGGVLRCHKLSFG